MRIRVTWPCGRGRTRSVGYSESQSWTLRMVSWPAVVGTDAPGPRRDAAAAVLCPKNHAGSRLSISQLRNKWIFALVNLFESEFAKPCETIIAKDRETLRNTAKSYLRKLAKLKHFCESIFAKASKSTCILHS